MLNFKPTIKSINITSNSSTKIVLEIKNGSLNGKYDDLKKLSGQEVQVSIQPDYFSYSVPYDRSVNAPMQEYVVNNDGSIDFIEKEQTQLEVDNQGNIDIENRNFVVTKEVIDEFISKAKSLEFPGKINPRQVLIDLKNGEPLSSIAEYFELSESALLDELERARAYYAPYADAWDKKRNEVSFPDNEE